ncbi:MAG TPA: hypothetical protein VIF44_06830 [Candidatus Limnocylindrales bacterium]|jgi:hypothetical protein
MTATITQIAIDNLSATPGQALASAAGGILIAFLLALITARLLLVVADTDRGRAVRAVVDLAIAPMLAAAALLLLGRLLEILPIG